MPFPALCRALVGAGRYRHRMAKSTAVMLTAGEREVRVSSPERVVYEATDASDHCGHEHVLITDITSWPSTPYTVGAFAIGGEQPPTIHSLTSRAYAGPSNGIIAAHRDRSRTGDAGWLSPER